MAIYVIMISVYFMPVSLLWWFIVTGSFWRLVTFLQYKFAPDLIMLDAYETIESWMITNKLNPRKLILAMMRYSSEPHAKYG